MEVLYPSLQALPAHSMNSQEKYYLFMEWESSASIWPFKASTVIPSSYILSHKSDRFVLTTDASDEGLGTILSTHCGNILEFASRTLTSTEKNYATIEKECLAIVWVIHNFRHYLIGAHFIVHTDHKPLEWLESSKASRAHSQHLDR